MARYKISVLALQQGNDRRRYIDACNHERQTWPQLFQLLHISRADTGTLGGILTGHYTLNRLAASDEEEEETAMQLPSVILITICEKINSG